MKALKERILRDGKCFEGGILKVEISSITKWILSS